MIRLIWMNSWGKKAWSQLAMFYLFHHGIVRVVVVVEGDFINYLFHHGILAGGGGGGGEKKR